MAAPGLFSLVLVPAAKLKIPSLPMLGSPAGSHRLQGCHAFCEKKQKSRHPLVASNSQPPYIRNPKSGTGGYTRLRLAEACPVSATRCAHCSHRPAF
jgi:hypothetical protein